MKIITLFLLFTIVALSQDFTIRSLDARSASNLAGSDIFLISNSSGTLNKVSYTNMMANLDDEAWVWTGNHDFNATTSITGGAFYIQNIKTASVAGELANTSSHTYLKYNGAQEDTLATWRHIWQDNGSTYGDWSLYGTQTIRGVLVGIVGSHWLMPSHTSTSFTSIGYTGSSGSGYMRFAYGSSAIDTLMSWRQMLLGVNSIYGAWTFNGDVTLSDVLGANVTGTISYAPGADVSPTATWDVDGLPQVINLTVASPTTVTSMVNMVEGQILVIVAKQINEDLTIQDNATINLRGGQDFVFHAGDTHSTLTLIYVNAKWSEISRSDITGEIFFDLDVNGTLTAGADVIYTPQVISLSTGAQDVAATNSFLVIAGTGSEPFAEIDDFTGIKNDGTKITVLGNPASGESFTINDGTDIVTIGGRDILMIAGDVMQFVCRTSKWYEVDSPPLPGTYGTMGFADSSATFNAAQNVFSPITNLWNNLFTDGANAGDLVFTGDSIQVTTAGDYDIEWDISYSGSNADLYHTAIFVNNVEQKGKGEAIRDMTGTSIGTTAGHTILTIAATHWVSLRIVNTANNGDPTFYAGNINIQKK